MPPQPLPGNYVSDSSPGLRYGTGVPTSGTNEVQTLTIAAVTGGSFTLSFDGYTTGDIPWSNVNATLLASIQAALDALPNLGASWIAATAGTLAAGLGTVLLTFSAGDVSKKAVPNITADGTNLLGGGASVSVAKTTPGVTASARSAPKGTPLMDTNTGQMYTNTGVAGAPVWTPS